ncbi:MAG: zf-HC2 domain-containing protein [Firmicutes bacterium]|nr:zf-HC2 domain-containing protein [Bacillota bacterium]
MCYDEGMLQAYLDRELPGRKRWEIEAHIATCRACKSLLIELDIAGKIAQEAVTSASQNLVISKMAIEEAWHRLAGDRRFGTPSNMKGVFGMTGKLKTVLISVAAVAVVAVMFSFAPVRQAAADILNIFRVQRVQTINITQDDLRQMREAGRRGGEVDIRNFGKFETTGFREPRAATYADAKATVDFNLTIPESIAGYNNPSFKISDESISSFTLDVAKANELIKSFGGTKILPAELDGKKFTAKKPVAVVATYVKEGTESLTIAQMRTPELILPNGVDAGEVRDVLLSLPILPDNVRSQLEAIKDWRYTLPIPSIDGSSKEVTVNGVSGVFITPPKDAQVGENVLVWQKDGVVNAIAGRVDLASAQGIAGLMR